MKRKFLSGVVFLFFLFSLIVVPGNLQLLSKVSDSTCTWVEKAHYNGYDFSSTLAVDPVNPGIIYAGMGKKLYKSTNYGNTWTAITNGLPSTFQSEAIAIDKQNHNIVYVTGGGSSGEGLYMTTDGGASWHKKIGDTFYGPQIAIDPKNHNRVYVPAENGRVYKTSDGGAHWTYKDLGSYFRAVAVSPIHTNIIYAGGKGGLYKTTDYGNSWTKIMNASDTQFVEKVIVDPKNEKLVYMYINDMQHHTTHFYLSSNGGIGGSWTVIDHGVYIHINDFEIDPKNPSTIYIADWSKGIVKSTDRGSHWAIISGSVHYTATRICVDPVHPAVLYSKMYESGGQNSHIYRLSCPVALPTNFSAYFIGNSVAFSWKYPDKSDIDYYTILYKQSGASSYKTLEPKVSATKTFFYRSNFASTNTTFDFAIAAYRETEHSPWVHDKARHLMKPTVTSLASFSNTETSSTVKVSWNKTTIDPNADYISIQRNDPDCTGWLCFPIEVKKINKGTTDFNRGYTYVSGLKFGKEYTITVMPKDKDNGSGEDSNSDDATIFIPEIPTDLEAYSSGSSIHLIWKYKSAARSTIDRFEVYETAPQTKYFGVVSNSLSSALLNFAGKQTGKYKFTVAAAKGNGRTYAMYDEAYLLKTPDKPVLAISDGKVKITWDKNAIDSNANKVIILKSTNGTTYTKLGVVDKSIEEFTDTSVSNSTTYYYKLQIAREVTGKMPDLSADSAPASIETPAEETTPSAPTNLSGTAVSSSEIDLTWSDNSDNEDGFKIERKEEGGTYSEVASLPADTTTYKDTGLSADTTYYYRVKAFNNKGESNYSNEISVKTESAPDTTPPILSITSPANFKTVNEDTVTVEGTATDNESGIDTVTVNDSTVTVQSDGSFSTTVSLSEGDNTITVIATDKAGNKTTKTIIVKYEKNNPPQEEKIIITLQPDNPYMTVNGVMKEIDPGRGTKPIIIPKWSRTVVPIRAIVESLGGTIEWDGTERKVTIHFNGTTIELWIDNPKAKVNSITKWIDPNNHDAEPIIINDRTMLPLRFVAESLGCTVDWDATTRTITITYVKP